MANSDQLEHRAKRDLAPRRAPSQKRSRERVDALLDAFGELLVERGFDDLNTHMIAERAGVPVGTLYQFFPNKYAIASALSRRYMDAQRVIIEGMSMEALAGLGVDEFIDGVTDAISANLLADEVLSSLWAVQMAVPELRSVLEVEESLRTEIGIKVFKPLLPGLPDDEVRQVSLTIMRVWYALLFAAIQETDERRGQTMSELKRLTKAYLHSHTE